MKQALGMALILALTGVGLATAGKAPVMVLVDGGRFTLGLPSDYAGPHDALSHPAHEVSLSPYLIGKFEVTQGEWLAVMGENPAFFNGKPRETDYGMDLRRPVERVSFYDILVYCNRLSLQEGLTPCYAIDGVRDPCQWGDVPLKNDARWNRVICDFSADGYRLPTEAEWTFAAWGRQPHQPFTYAGSDEFESLGWIGANSGGQTHPVGQKAPNALGLCDMTGNVWEWTWDAFGLFSSSSQRDPSGPTDTDPGHRIDKGGGFRSEPWEAVLGFRGECRTVEKAFGLGFRLARKG